MAVSSRDISSTVTCGARASRRDHLAVIATTYKRKTKSTKSAPKKLTAQPPSPVERRWLTATKIFLVILLENFASLTGSRTRAFRLLKSPAVDPPPKAA